MAHSIGIQTPVGDIAPYNARQTDVPVGTDAGRLTVLLRAPPNANVQLVSLSAYGDWGLNVLPFFYLVPPEGSLNLGLGSPNSYCLFFYTGDLNGTSIAAPLPYYSSERFMNGAQCWIPAGWSLAVGPSATTSGSSATFSAVGILHPSITAGAFQN